MARTTDKFDGKTSLYGLIGHPIGHTFSPLIHNTLADLTGQNLVYVPFDVAKRPGEDLADKETVGAAIKGALALNVKGMNVTVPYKQDVIPFLDQIDPVADKIGAVNTLVRTDKGYRGYNTDYIGLWHALYVHGIRLGKNPAPEESSWKSPKSAGEHPVSDVVIVGAGGAARAAAFLCGVTRVKSLVILNRTLDKARALADDVKKAFPDLKVSATALDKAGDLRVRKCLAIQCTKVGLAPKTEETPIQDARFYKKVSYAYDAIYNPEETLFLKKVKEAGGDGWNGLEMLLYQAIEAYELWTNASITRDQTRIVKNALHDFIHGKKLRNYCLVGFMGSGKTRIGKALAKRAGMEFLDTDALIEEQAGMSISKIFEAEGEPGFRNRETNLLKSLVEERREGCVFSTGGGLVLREENRELLKKLGTVILLDIDFETAMTRLANDKKRPLLQNGNREQKVKGLLTTRRPIYEKCADVVIPVDNGRPADKVKKILAKAPL